MAMAAYLALVKQFDFEYLYTGTPDALIATYDPEKPTVTTHTQ